MNLNHASGTERECAECLPRLKVEKQTLAVSWFLVNMAFLNAPAPSTCFWAKAT